MAPTLGNGKICYLEIPTADVARSVRFYQAVFGWKTRQRGDGATAFDDGVGQVSGAWVTGRPASPAPGLLLYVMVDSLRTTVDAILGSGGRIVQPVGAGRAGAHRQVRRSGRQRARALPGAPAGPGVLTCRSWQIACTRGSPSWKSTSAARTATTSTG